MAVYMNKEGKKMYPVCSWEANQHKLYNAHDRLMCEFYEGNRSEDIFEKIDEVEKAMDIFDAHVIKGIVYATWEDGLLIKKYVGKYDARKAMIAMKASV